MILKRIEKPFFDVILPIGTATGVFYENKHSKSGNLYVDVTKASGSSNTNVYVYSGYNTNHMFVHASSGAIAGGNSSVIHLDNLGILLEVVPVVSGALVSSAQVVLELNENI